jgi:hypothetical protein
VYRRQINLIKFIFEAYDGLAVVTTLNREEGRVVISIAPGWEVLADEVINDLGKKIMIEPCNTHPKKITGSF